MTAFTYLMEELGDARMRCDQLLRYIDKATKLIEKSSHKDHFFEVAGDLIRGIPETAFKMHKALQAVALAANRIDYEEIKQDLRPEKAEELERVLEDVRVRQVQRRSLPMLEPKEVVEQLRGLAKRAREQGQLDTDRLSSLIASLEAGAPKVADDVGAKAAGQLEAMAHALENPPGDEKPSRTRLAQVLRKTLAEHIEVSGQGKVAAEGQWTPAAQAKLDMGLASLSLKKAAQREDNSRYTKHHVGEALGALNRSLQGLMQPKASTDALGRAALVIHQQWSEVPLPPEFPKAASDDERRSRHEEGKPADPTKNMSEEDAKEWKENTEEYGDKFKKEARGELMMLPPNGVATFSAPDAAAAVQSAIDSLKHLSRLLSGSGAMRPGAISLSFKEALVELGQAAWHLNLPDVNAILEKAKMKTRVKSVDRIAFVGVEPQSLEGVDAILDNLLKAARFTKGYGDQANYERMFFNLIKVVGYVQALGENFEIPGLGILDRVEKILVPYAGGSRPMIAAKDGKRSRYEEGKPADPTKNMSEADAKEWKENTEEYGDKFKSAGEKVAKKIPAPDDPSIVREIMDWHGGQGSNLYSVGSTWNAGRPVDADDAEEAYDELERKKADDDALDAFREHLREHGVRVATDKESFGGRGRVYLHYVKGGTKRREGPLDPQLAKRRMVALMEDGSVSEADFERKAATANLTKKAPGEDWKAVS